jgi:hypothetical protein
MSPSHATMDRVHQRMTGSPSSPTASFTLPPARSKPSMTNAPSFSPYQTKVNGASPVRRKPVPSSASIGSAGSGPRQPLSSGGLVVAVGEEDTYDNTKPFKADEADSLHRVPWLPSPSASPELVVRDLDQYVNSVTNPPKRRRLTWGLLVC